tara:strand:- start:1472 stop:1654 length:183 start_codon:yes stop_codon:yes gene_type:complete
LPQSFFDQHDKRPNHTFEFCLSDEILFKVGFDAPIDNAMTEVVGVTPDGEPFKSETTIDK